MSTRHEPWERQAGESSPAFEAFAAYRDMGVKRSTSKVSRQLGKSETLTHRWSSKWSWVARADAWDRELDRLWRAEQNEVRIALARKHLRVGAAMISKVAERLSTIRADDIAPRDLERWVHTATLIETRAAGEPEDSDASGIKAAAGLVTELVRGLRDIS